MKNRIIKLFIAILIVIILSSSVLIMFSMGVIGNDSLSWIGKIFKEEKSDPGADDIALRINTVEYSNSSINTYLRLYESDLKTEQEILNIFIERELLKQEANTRGITVTKEEVDIAVAEQLYLYESMPDIQNQVNEILKAQQITYDEYIELLRTTFYSSISVGKLKQQLEKEAVDTYNEKISGTHIDEYIKKYIDKYTKTLIDSANIEYLSYNKK